MFEVYATRWDDPHVIEQIPAQGLEFTLPLSDHGECSFSATVEAGRSFWRPALNPAVSGVMVCRDGVPVWSGKVWSERQSGPRTFEFTCAEWGSAFERMPAVAKTYTDENDHVIFRDLITQAQAITGQDMRITLGATLGASTSDLTINPWDDTTVEAQFTQLSNADGGPEWYFHTTGTLQAPVRFLVLGDRLGRTDAVDILEYVESTTEWTAPESPPQPTTLGNLFPGAQPYAVLDGNRGGNIIAQPARSQDASGSATVAIAIGSGDQKAQLRYTSVADDLINAGYPRQTMSTSYPDVSKADTLVRHANADLAAARGVVTGYTLSTYEDDPDWTQIERGDTVRVSLDTDVYAGQRPLEFEARVLSMAVSVPDTGPAQVNYTLATVGSL